MGFAERRVSILLSATADDPWPVLEAEMLDRRFPERPSDGMQVGFAGGGIAFGTGEDDPGGPTPETMELGVAVDARRRAVRVLAEEWDLHVRTPDGPKASKRLERSRRELERGRGKREWEAFSEYSDDAYVRLYADDLAANAKLIEELANFVGAAVPVASTTSDPDAVLAAHADALLSIARHVDEAVDAASADGR